MRLFPDIDSLAEYAFEVRSRYGSVGAQDLEMIQGHGCQRCRYLELEDPEEARAHGRKPRRVWRWPGRETKITLGFRNEPAEGTTVCTECWRRLQVEHGGVGAMDRVQQALWLEDRSGECAILRGQVQTHSRSAATEADIASRIDDWSQVRRLFLPPRSRDRGGWSWTERRWLWGLEAYRLRLHAYVGTDAAIVLCGAVQAPQWADWWNAPTVSTWVPRVREKLEDRAWNSRHGSRLISRRIAKETFAGLASG